jgi:RNA polymerase subunit RPABC4/transcription elongation factor Spt4
MIFNCLNCGLSVSTQRSRCPYCKKDNSETIEMLTGIIRRPEKAEWRDKVKGTILSYVHR